MKRHPLHVGARLLALAFLTAASLAVASGASASNGVSGAGPAIAPQAWVGRFCPIGGCTGPPGNGLLNATGFGGAVLIAGWWARQRSHLED